MDFAQRLKVHGINTPIFPYIPLCLNIFKGFSVLIPCTRSATTDINVAGFWHFLKKLQQSCNKNCKRIFELVDILI